MGFELPTTAEELVERTQGVVLRVGVENWLWQPFADPCEKNQLDEKRHKFLEKYQAAQSHQERLELGAKIIELRGFQLRGGRLKMASSSYRVHGQRGKLYRYGGLEEFAKPFQNAVDGWDDERPNWDEIGRVLVARGVVPNALTLEPLNLIQIRTVLTTLPAESEPSTKNRRKVARVRALTIREKEVIDLKDRELSYQEIGEMLGISKQSAQEAYKRAEDKVKRLHASKSASARSGIPDYDEFDGAKPSSRA